jgi:autotransporter-associated beta strand protein
MPVANIILFVAHEFGLPPSPFFFYKRDGFHPELLVNARASDPKTWFRERVTVLLLFLVVSVSVCRAGSATWSSSPTNGSWRQAINWSPNTIPNGPTDVATFGASDLTKVKVSGTLEVASIIFQPEAPAYQVLEQEQYNPSTLVLSGAGVINNSGMTQMITVMANSPRGPGTLSFKNNADAGGAVEYLLCPGPSLQTGGAVLLLQDAATAGTASVVNEGGYYGFGGATLFAGTSSAAGATVTNEGATSSSGSGGSTLLEGTSTGGEASFIANGGTAAGAAGGLVLVIDNATGGNASFTANGGSAAGASGGMISFTFASDVGTATATANGESLAGGGAGTVILASSATAGEATLVATGATADGEAGGSIILADDSLGGNARIELFGNGSFDISSHELPGVSVGSIEGSGVVFLGAMNLEVGGNDLTTMLSGSINDGGGSSGAGGSLTKGGTGTLTLSGANSYTGGTTVNNGALLVNNATGSGTGSGGVAVNGGTLGGDGVITGAVTVGTGNGSGARLQPSFGTNNKVALTIQSLLTIKSDGTYNLHLKSSTAEVVTNGLTIESGAQFVLTGPNRKLPTGKKTTVISNTSAAPITGTFANLPDGGTITNGNNTFQADYQGGDGNDLTLTALP